LQSQLQGKKKQAAFVSPETLFSRRPLWHLKNTKTLPNSTYRRNKQEQNQWCHRSGLEGRSVALGGEEVLEREEEDG
jgi:hypothetical protein